MRNLILLAAAIPLTAAGDTFQARWMRALRPDVRGELSVDDNGIAFRPSGDKTQSLQWRYEEIQHLDRRSPSELSVLSYHDALLQMGRDRRFRFSLLDGAIPDQLFESVARRVGKPATDRAVGEPQHTELSLPAKRVGWPKGSQGTLHFTAERILYVTDIAGGSRSWRLDRDIESIWSSDPYRLEVHVFGGGGAFARRTKVFRFSLKRPLEPDRYRFHKRRLLDRQALR